MFKDFDLASLRFKEGSWILRLDPPRVFFETDIALSKGSFYKKRDGRTRIKGKQIKYVLKDDDRVIMFEDLLEDKENRDWWENPTKMKKSDDFCVWKWFKHWIFCQGLTPGYDEKLIFPAGWKRKKAEVEFSVLIDDGLLTIIEK